MIRLPRDRQSGFTLVEVLIALALFSLIGIAGYTLVSGVVGVQQRTDERLERLAELQRAMHLLTFDLEQLADGAITFDGATLSFRRNSVGRPPAAIRYDLADGTFRRILSGDFGAPRTQRLIAHVAALRWQFYAPRLGWLDNWPPDPRDPAELPAAVAAYLRLADDAAGPTGVLRRVVQLPAKATP